MKLIHCLSAFKWATIVALVCLHISKASSAPIVDDPTASMTSDDQTHLHSSTTMFETAFASETGPSVTASFIENVPQNDITSPNDEDNNIENDASAQASKDEFVESGFMMVDDEQNRNNQQVGEKEEEAINFSPVAEVVNEEDDDSCGMSDYIFSSSEKTQSITLDDEKALCLTRFVLRALLLRYIDNGLCDNVIVYDNESNKPEAVTDCQTFVDLLSSLKEKEQNENEVSSSEDSAIENVDAPEYAAVQDAPIENIEYVDDKPSESVQTLGDHIPIFPAPLSFDDALIDASANSGMQVRSGEDKSIQENLNGASASSTFGFLRGNANTNEWGSVDIPTPTMGNGGGDISRFDAAEYRPTECVEVEEKRYLIHPLFIFPFVFFSCIASLIFGTVYNNCKGRTEDSNKILKVPRMAIFSEFPNISGLIPSMKSMKLEQGKKGNITV